MYVLKNTNFNNYYYKHCYLLPIGGICTYLYLRVSLNWLMLNNRLDIYYYRRCVKKASTFSSTIEHFTSVHIRSVFAWFIISHIIYVFLCICRCKTKCSNDCTKKIILKLLLLGNLNENNTPCPDLVFIIYFRYIYYLM